MCSKTNENTPDPVPQSMSVPQGPRCTLRSTQCYGHMNPTSFCSGWAPTPSHQEQIEQRWGRGRGGLQALTQHTGLSRTRQFTSSPEQEKTRPGKEMHPAQAVMACYLFTRKHSRPKPALKQPCKLHTTTFSQEGRIQGQPPGLWFKQLGGWWVRLLRRERVGKRQWGGKQRKNSQEILKNTCGFPPACPPRNPPPPLH